MHTQSQWEWGKHSGRAVVEPQFELTGVKPPRILVFVFLRVASTNRCLTEYDFLWPIQPVGSHPSPGILVLGTIMNHVVAQYSRRIPDPTSRRAGILLNCWTSRHHIYMREAREHHRINQSSYISPSMTKEKDISTM